MVSNRSGLLSSASLLLAATLHKVSGQALVQPVPDVLYSSHAGQGAIPFDFRPSSYDKALDLTAKMYNPNGYYDTYPIAVGLLNDSAIFAPVNLCGPLGECPMFTCPSGLHFDEGAVHEGHLVEHSTLSAHPTLQPVFNVYEKCNDGSSGPPQLAATRNITVVCAPIQAVSPQQRDSKMANTVKRAGPSGQLVIPPGNTQYGQGGVLQVSYEPVTFNGQTFGIDATLVGPAGNFTVSARARSKHCRPRRPPVSCLNNDSHVFPFQLVNGLFKPEEQKNIEASFVLPQEACGDFRVVVVEHQIYQYSAIEFQSAAPAVHVHCPDSEAVATGVPRPTTPKGGSPYVQ